MLPFDLDSYIVYKFIKPYGHVCYVVKTILRINKLHEDKKSNIFNIFKNQLLVKNLLDKSCFSMID